ncbi:MAG: hypothetical protein AB1467_06760 [Candidatus Diapherotrites archaeon]
MIERHETGRIQCNALGEATIILEEITGKIIKIKIEYGTTEPETSITITTSEEEKIEYYQNNEDFIDYPRNPINAGKFFKLRFGEETSMQTEHYYNNGDLTIKIENAGENKTLNNITIITEQ